MTVWYVHPILSQSLENSTLTKALSIQIKCIGQKPNSGLIAELSPSSISESGYIKVLPTLQIADEAHGNIYAIGDVADTGSIKNGRAAVEQAQFVAENIVRAIKGKRSLKYRPQWFEGITDLTLGLVSDCAFL